MPRKKKKKKSKQEAPHAADTSNAVATKLPPQPQAKDTSPTRKVDIDVMKRYEIQMFECLYCERPCYDCIHFWCLNCKRFNSTTAITIKTKNVYQKINALDQYEPTEGLEFLIWGFIRAYHEKHQENNCFLINAIVPSSIKLLCCQYYFIMDSKFLSMNQQFTLLKEILCKKLVARHMRMDLLLAMGDKSDLKYMGKQEFGSIVDDKLNTLTVIESDRDHIFGFYLQQKWRDSYRNPNPATDNSFIFLLSDNDGSTELKPKVFGRRIRLGNQRIRQDVLDHSYLAVRDGDIELYVPPFRGLQCFVKCTGTAFDYNGCNLCGRKNHGYSMRVKNIEIYQLHF